LLIIFDLDDTIIDTSGSILPYKLEAGLKAMCEKGLIFQNREKALAMLSSIDAGSESTKIALKEFLEIHQADPSYLDHACQVIYRQGDFLHPVAQTKGAYSSLMELSKTHTLAIVSAGIREIQFEKLKKAGIDTSIFSRIVICEELGKKECYLNLLEDLMFLPSEVVVCGDRVRRDLSPGKELGFTTIHMKWGRGLQSHGDEADVDYSIYSLEQVKPILMQL